MKEEIKTHDQQKHKVYVDKEGFVRAVCSPGAESPHLAGLCRIRMSENLPSFGRFKIRFENGRCVETKETWITETYVHRRVRDYPPITEQLDALWKGGEHAAEMKKRIDAVKAKHPKT